MVIITNWEIPFNYFLSGSPQRFIRKKLAAHSDISVMMLFFLGESVARVWESVIQLLETRKKVVNSLDQILIAGPLLNFWSKGGCACGLLRMRTSFHDDENCSKFNSSIVRRVSLK